MIINENYYDLSKPTKALNDMINTINSYHNSDSKRKLEVLFVSIPMRDRKLTDIQDEFVCMANKVNVALPEDTDLYVIPSLFDYFGDTPIPAHQCIVTALSFLAYATIVSIPYDNYKHRGCKFEQEYAMNYLLPTGTACIIYQPRYNKEDMSLQWYNNPITGIKTPKFGSMYGIVPFAPSNFFVSHYTIEDQPLWEDNE